jgi:Domain of unknown function (DUF4126)
MPQNLDHATVMTIVSAALAGVAIAAACGLRAFLPLLALALASRFGLVHLSASAGWMGSNAALWSLGVAAVLEMLADKVPVVDHALDVVGTFVRPAAAAVAGWATFGDVNPLLAWVAALVLGSGAMGIHALKAKTRLGSTALTLGHANPLLSAGEDVTAAGISAAAIFVPFAAAAVVLVVVGWVAMRRK